MKLSTIAKQFTEQLNPSLTGLAKAEVAKLVEALLQKVADENYEKGYAAGQEATNEAAWDEGYEEGLGDCRRDSGPSYDEDEDYS